MSVVMLTKTPLQANMSYIQAGRDRFESGIPAGSVSGLVWADKAGTLYLEESDDDGVTWSQTTNVSVSASTTTVLPWTALTKQQYRFRYVNGAAAQTKFRLVQQTRGMELTTVDLSPLENRIDAITSGDTPATAQLTGSNIVESITHDDFNANANLQIGNEDVDDENPVPAKLVGSIIPDSQAVPTKLTGSIETVVDNPATGIKTITTTAAELFAGAYAKTNRRKLIIKNEDQSLRFRIGKADITQQNGFPVEPGAVVIIPFDPAVIVPIYAISEGASLQASVMEV